MREDTASQFQGEIDSFRYIMSKDGKTGTLSLVVGGMHHLIPCKLTRAFHFIASVGEAVAKRED